MNSPATRIPNCLNVFSLHGRTAFRFSTMALFSELQPNSTKTCNPQVYHWFQHPFVTELFFLLQKEISKNRHIYMTFGFISFLLLFIWRQRRAYQVLLPLKFVIIRKLYVDECDSDWGWRKQQKRDGTHVDSGGKTQMTK